MMLPHQIRAARAARGWTREDLAQRAAVHPKTIAIYERPAPPEAADPQRQRCRAKVERALTADGVIEFADGQLRIGTTPPA